MGLFLPLGLAYISATIASKGYEYDCIDLHNEEKLNEGNFDLMGLVNKKDLSSYDVVAFGGTFLKFQDLELISGEIYKKNPAIFQIAGGIMATSISDYILKQTKINCVCLHEGEESILELLDKMEGGRNWKEVKGIKYLDNGGEVVSTGVREKIDALDTFPFPDREKWSFSMLRKSFPMGTPGRYSAIVFASRGCPFSCTFCSPVSGKVIRTRSPEHIVAEIKYLRDRWNVRYIRFFDEVFIGSKKKIRALCELMIKEKLEVFWCCQTQVRLLDRETIKIMKDAGCIEIAYGIESGSNEILKEMQKGITKEQSREAIETTYELGVMPTLNMIAGTPSETKATIEETRDFLISLNHIHWVQIPTISFIVPIPGTPLYEQAVKGGFIGDAEQYMKEGIANLGRYSGSINLTEMTDEEFVSTVERCNREVVEDYFKKHPLKRVLASLGLDHLRYDLILSNLSVGQIRPILESIAWATFGKRETRAGKAVASLIYGR